MNLQTYHKAEVNILDVSPEQIVCTSYGAESPIKYPGWGWDDDIDY